MSQQHAMSAHTRYRGVHLCIPVVMNRSCARGAASRVWVTIRVQAGGCVHGMVLSCYPPSRVPEEPPDLSAWRQNEKEEGGTGVTPVLKGILQKITDN